MRMGSHDYVGASIDCTDRTGSCMTAHSGRRIGQVNSISVAGPNRSHRSASLDKKAGRERSGRESVSTVFWMLRRCVIDCPLRQETVEAEAYLAQKKVNVTWLVTDKKERANSPTKKARIDANGTSPGLILKRKQLRSSTVSNTAETPAAKPGVDCRDMVRNHSRSRFPCGGLSLRTNSTCFASRVTGFVSQ